MKITSTDIPGLLILEPKIFNDDRGYFFESYNKNVFEINKLDIQFIQDNQAKSTYGVIRGLHYQLAPYTQTKLIRVLKGEIYDVAVDIRKNSPTFGKWTGVHLSEENQKQLIVPKGFAHGYSVLSKEAIILYKCDDFYNKESERGIMYNDPAINIDWKIDTNKSIISAKDKVLHGIEKAEMNFYFNKL